MMPATTTSCSVSSPVLNTRWSTPGRLSTAQPGVSRWRRAVRFQLARAADDVVDLFTAVPVQRRVVPGLDLDDAEAECHRVEPGLRIDQLQVADHPAGLLHGRAVEPRPGLDHHARPRWCLRPPCSSPFSPRVSDPGPGRSCGTTDPFAPGFVDILRLRHVYLNNLPVDRGGTTTVIVAAHAPFLYRVLRPPSPARTPA